MSDMDFYAQVIVTGRVMGASLASSPEQWAQELGANYVDARRKALMRRDFGLVEVSFQRVRGVWECFGMAIQVHRLVGGRDGVVPAPVGARFGDFGPLVLFATLDDVVARAGHHLENDNDETTSHHDRFVLPETGAHVHVVSQVDDPDSGGPQVGHVWSIQLSASAG
ncbi:MAG: hypothetical protein QOI21_2521 [Actinomycetota bacterium]|nr:hypothetical protein [Actinomycetota bacterium]